MAAFMSSTFTAPDRRKKVVTYGKASRLAQRPHLTASSDAPSPERPRKHTTAASNGASKSSEGAPKVTGSSWPARLDAGSVDIFDVPSDDDVSTPAIKPTNAVTEKRKALPIGGRATTKVAHSEQEPKKTILAADAPKKTHKPTEAPKIAQASRSAVEPPIVRSTRLGKAPRPTHELRQSENERPSAQRAKATGKGISVSASKQEVPILKAAKSAKTNTLSQSNSARVALLKKPQQPADIFDVPSSDDESHMPTPKPIRRALIATRIEPARPLVATEPPPDTESDDSVATKKRKRRGSVPSVVAQKPVVEQKEDGSLPQRSRKSQKKKGEGSPGHDHTQPPSTSTHLDAQPIPSAVNKPRRTRLRTVSVLEQPLITKGQSSPATLNSMLPLDRTSKPSTTTEAPELTVLEDDTMYDIPEPRATPLRRRPEPSVGSVTPRQKALFGSLLGTSSSTTPMPSISKLQLTDRKPSSLLGALSRSKSDLCHSTHAKKTRLIASLKQPESSSDDATSESDSESDSDSDEQIQSGKSTANAPKNGKDHTATSVQAISIEDDEMDVDNEEAADSQTSQATLTFGMRSKFTYAKARSYLQEANPEDALLLSMDLDEPITFGTQSKDSQVEEEEEASQVRPNHELKRQGHNTKFHWDNQMLIDDMATKSNNSIRRSAMLELCTKMADETFSHDLLESALADDFFENASSTGETIFDFAVAVAAIFILRGKPNYTALDQVMRSEIPSILHKLLDNDSDIIKIAKNRKSNFSRIAQESVATFRSTLLTSPCWPSTISHIVSPRVVALKALDLLVTRLRHTGNTESIISQETAGKVADITASASEHAKHQGIDGELKTVFMTTFSILEAVSLAKQKPIAWSVHMLQCLAKAMPVAFRTEDASMITSAVKLCMNLTNNKPKSCQFFSDKDLVQALVRAIVDRAKLLQADMDEMQRTEALDTLILSLGAMINLTEHSNQARINVDDGRRLIEDLVATFVDGSVRTAQAVSMEASQSSVVVGYLSVLLGNMCLNKAIKSKIRHYLPDQSLAILVEKIKEFLHVHEQINRSAKQFEGKEGQETWQNYTARIMQVVEHLEEYGV